MTQPAKPGTRSDSRATTPRASFSDCAVSHDAVLERVRHVLHVDAARGSGPRLGSPMYRASM